LRATRLAAARSAASACSWAKLEGSHGFRAHTAWALHVFGRNMDEDHLEGLALGAIGIRSFHPPAGIDPLVVVIHNMSWDFVLAPVAAGAVLLALFAFLWHNLARRGSWPLRWW
jgi:hypothetical protein